MAFNTDTAMKSTLWEEAKGKLRALAGIQGSYDCTDDKLSKRYRDAQHAIEKFIEEFENNGLHE